MKRAAISHHFELEDGEKKRNTTSRKYKRKTFPRVTKRKMENGNEIILEIKHSSSVGKFFFVYWLLMRVVSNSISKMRILNDDEEDDDEKMK